MSVRYTVVLSKFLKWCRFLKGSREEEKRALDKYTNFLSRAEKLTIPDGFDEAFLKWFREETERAWAKYNTLTFDHYVACGGGGGGGAGGDWQQGTRWLGGLSDSEINAIEQRWLWKFPPDYRLFLRYLHTTDRPQVGAAFSGKRLKPVFWPGVWNWQRDQETIQRAIERFFEGLVLDVERNNVWLPVWGVKPQSPKGREEQLRALVATAPRLIPVAYDTFLLAEPHRAGNPVLSVHQSEIIICATDLRSFLLGTLYSLIGVSVALPMQYDPSGIPFWGEWIIQNNRRRIE